MKEKEAVNGIFKETLKVDDVQKVLQYWSHA